MLTIVFRRETKTHGLKPFNIDQGVQGTKSYCRGIW